MVDARWTEDLYTRFYLRTVVLRCQQKGCIWICNPATSILHHSSMTNAQSPSSPVPSIFGSFPFLILPSTTPPLHHLPPPAPPTPNHKSPLSYKILLKQFHRIAAQIVSTYLLTQRGLSTPTNPTPPPTLFSNPNLLLPPLFLPQKKSHRTRQQPASPTNPQELSSPLDKP